MDYNCNLFFIFLLSVSALAYLSLIPKGIKNIPYYDKISFFLLFGILGFSVHLAFNRKTIKIFNLSLPVGILLVSVYAITDETLQLFSKVRTFDLFDLGFGLLGIFTFYLIDRILLKIGTE